LNNKKYKLYYAEKSIRIKNFDSDLNFQNNH